VYDMYHWDQPEPPGLASLTGARHSRRPAGRTTYPRRPAARTPRPGPVQAVQVALDRRDNGGDPGAPHDQ
jgi:hypothetical protein